MIEATHSLVIATGIDDVWDHVQDIGNWASLFPGCRDVEIIDDSNSRWLIKVGTAGMVKTVTVLVRVDQWSGPGRVNFSFNLESEPVVGSGTYIATPKSDIETDIGLQVRVEGSGQMAQMWEAMSRPLLPQMARTFADRLKLQIEESAPAAPEPAAAQPATPEPATPNNVFAALAGWLGNVWWALLGSPTEKTSRSRGDICRLEQHKSVVLAFLEAMSSGNAAMAETCLARDACTVAKGYGRFAGIRHRETMIATIDSFNRLIPGGLNIEVKSVTASGNTVVVEFEGNAITVAGKPYHNQYCMVFMLVGGKIKQVNEYFCSIHADEVLWPLVEQQAGNMA